MLSNLSAAVDNFLEKHSDQIVDGFPSKFKHMHWNGFNNVGNKSNK